MLNIVHRFSRVHQDYPRKERCNEHEHKYRNDEDRRAHDYGYDQGWGGHRYDNRRR